MIPKPLFQLLAAKSLYSLCLRTRKGPKTKTISFYCCYEVLNPAPAKAPGSSPHLSTWYFFCWLLKKKEHEFSQTSMHLFWARIVIYKEFWLLIWLFLTRASFGAYTLIFWNKFSQFLMISFLNAYIIDWIVKCIGI